MLARLSARICVIVLAALTLSACSSRKNTAANRKYQEFITRYNIHYNGATHFSETLQKMERDYEDDFSRLLPVHPAQARADRTAPQPQGDFTRSIEKAQKAIQVRSIKKKPARKPGKSRDPKYKEWMKRDEYNPFLHNSWLMMGRSQYYNGDFLGAASTFFYISRHFAWLPRTVTEAKLMQAMCYIALGWQFEAEMILTRIKENDLADNRLRRLYNLAYADFYIHTDDLTAALPFMEMAAAQARGPQSTRLNFLLGQLYERTGDRNRAYTAFGKAGKSSSAPYRTKFNARIKQSEVFAGTDIEPEIKALSRMTRYDRNKEYLDQIYYAIGNLCLSRGDTARAISNYILANEKSTRSGIDKAINQLRLGDIYFARHNYDLAQPCYSEALPLLPQSYPGYDSLKRRSDVLDELAVYSQNISLQDSLLRLAAMTPDERNAVIAGIIAELERKEKEAADEARREEYLAQQAAGGQSLADNNTQSFTINSDNSWYFYNTTVKNAGKTEFQKRWGSRKLEDNWRRRNKNTFNTDEFDPSDPSAPADSADTSGQADSPEVAAADTAAAARASDPHYPEYYLAAIPATEAEITNANDIIQEGLYNLGIILKDKLEDYPAAQAEFDRLLARYPDNVYRLDTYYNLYLMYMRLGRTAEADRYRRMITEQFPESAYGVALKNPDYIDNLRNMDARQQQLYEQTYAAYLENRNDDVHRAYRTMESDYPLSKIMPKFMFLHALAYVTENKPDEFAATLRELLERYPSTDITPLASAWLKGLAKGRKLNAGTSNIRAMLWDLRLTNDSTATDSTAAVFRLNPDEPQLLVFTFATDEVSAPQLLFDIARHNFSSFVVKDFDLESMNFGRLGIIAVGGFGNMAELNHYRKVMAESDVFRLPRGVRPIAISDADFKTLIAQGRSFEEYFRYRDEQNYIDAQAELLAPEDIEPLPPEENAEPAPAAPANLPDTAQPQADAPAPTPAVATPAAGAAPKKPAAPQPPVPVPLLPGSEGDDDPLLLEP